jgi:hypothetical protein
MLWLETSQSAVVKDLDIIANSWQMHIRESNMCHVSAAGMYMSAQADREKTEDKCPIGGLYEEWVCCLG